jgi:hypothetical protein
MACSPQNTRPKRWHPVRCPAGPGCSQALSFRPLLHIDPVPQCPELGEGPGGEETAQVTKAPRCRAEAAPTVRGLWSGWAAGSGVHPSQVCRQMVPPCAVPKPQGARIMADLGGGDTGSGKQGCGRGAGACPVLRTQDSSPAQKRVDSKLFIAKVEKQSQRRPVQQ